MEKNAGSIARCLGRNAAFPVVLVSTRDNIITAAMIHYFSLDPPIIGVGIGRKRHSFELIRAEQAFVVNVPTADQLALVESAGNISGRDGDKFARLGLTREAAEQVDSSLIGECPVNIECRLVREIEFDERVWFLGRVVAVHEAAVYDSTQSIVYSNSMYYAVGRAIGRRGG